MANNPRERWLIIAALAIIVVFIGDRFIVEPLIGVWKARNERIATLDRNLANGQQMIDRKSTIEERWAAMRQHSLPADKTTAENAVLTAVGAWSSASHLTNVTAIKPHWTASEDEVNSLEVRVTANGDLASIARFLYELEKDPIAVRLADVDLRARDDKGAELTLEARFTGLILPEVKP